MKTDRLNRDKEEDMDEREWNGKEEMKRDVRERKDQKTHQMEGN